MHKLLVSASLLGLCVSGSIALAQHSSVKTRRPIAVPNGYFASLHRAPKHTRSNKLSAATNVATHAQDPRIVSVPNFTRSFTVGSQTFPYTMVGHQPTARRTSEIPTTYVPMSFFFDEFVDQNGNNIVIDATAITDEIVHSPMFENADYATGFTQFGDAQMRAEFFFLFNKDGDNDGNDRFHVLLNTPKTLIPVTIEVPIGSSQVFVLPDGTFFALIDINFLLSQLNTLAQTEPLTVDSIPIFLTRNAVYGDFIQQQPIDCCIGGFHTAFETQQVRDKIFVQTFSFATSLDADVANGIFGDPGLFADVNALSHEVTEALNDPFANNVTPNYQIPGAPAGFCQVGLEVGDVIENLTPDYTNITLHGFTYHPQTEALLQWFEGKTPSDAVDGDYSFPDPTRLTSSFMPCPTGP